MTNITFAEWFNRKFLDWRNAQEDRKANLTSFSNMLGIKRPSISHYLNGNAEPEGENLFRIATKLGFEVYGTLGYDQPDHAVKEWQALYDLAPPDLRDELLEMNRQWLKKKGL
jgi:transcriptional regulator with XRE-family HTH domain